MFSQVSVILFGGGERQVHLMHHGIGHMVGYFPSPFWTSDLGTYPGGPSPLRDHTWASTTPGHQTLAHTRLLLTSGGNH